MRFFYIFYVSLFFFLWGKIGAAPTQARYPDWFLDYGIVNAQPPSFESDAYQVWLNSNYAPANVGQLKWVATQAHAYLAENLNGGAGFSISSLFAPPPERGEANTTTRAEYEMWLRQNYSPVNIGQLKAVAAPFYRRLKMAGYDGWNADLKSALNSEGYPWDENTSVDANYLMANLGQLKFVFSWDLTGANILDINQDGIGDLWAVQNGLNPFSDDSDGDGLLDFQELYLYRTNPLLSDSDSDNLSDYEEIFQYHTNPNLKDSDGDGIPDYLEINCYETNPNVANTLDVNLDSDDDGLKDVAELSSYGTNPFSADSDEDGLSDYEEINGVTRIKGEQVVVYFTDPMNWDSDSDGFGDFVEIETLGLHPNIVNDPDEDSDGDGLNSFEEIHEGTLLSNVDTDGDGIRDGVEVKWRNFAITSFGGYTLNPLEVEEGSVDFCETAILQSTAPVDATTFEPKPTGCDKDIDMDGICDCNELLVLGTNPYCADSDYDGLSDRDEVLIYRTNPLLFDTDGDGISDGVEASLWDGGANTAFNPTIGDDLLADPDNDGVATLQELYFGLNPLNADSDGDGISDGVELRWGMDPLSATIIDPNTDTDGDGLKDVQELAGVLSPYLSGQRFYTNPFAADTDKDGLNDYEELYPKKTQTEHEAEGCPLSSISGSACCHIYDHTTTCSLIESGRFATCPHVSNPTKRDTDGDSFSDKWELKYLLIGVDTVRFSPVIVDNPGGDYDGDGLDNESEDSYLTNPHLADSDADDVSDGEEIKYGTNPNDFDSRPVFPAEEEEPDPPIAQFRLSVPSASATVWGSAFTISVTAPDGSFVYYKYVEPGNTGRGTLSINTELLQEGGAYTFNLTCDNNQGWNNSKYYKCHCWIEFENLPNGLYMTGNSLEEFQDVAEPKAVSLSMSLLDSLTSKISGSPPPGVPPPQVAMGAKYRKIALNGYPLSDERPQDMEETDNTKEETFVDAFDLTLNHSTTDIYIPPVAGSDLALCVRRNYTGEIWNLRSGARPHERLDRPFGAGWSSNLGAHLRSEMTRDVETGEITGKYVFVVDEDGQCYRFIQAITTQGDSPLYYPCPSGHQEKDALMTRLERNSENKFVFTKKFGTKLTFSAETAAARTYHTLRDFNIRTNSSTIESSTAYHRLESVKDRFGTELSYIYPQSLPTSLVPQYISYWPNGKSGTAEVSTQHIEIFLDSAGKVAGVSCNGQTVSYSYGTLTVSTGISSPLLSSISVSPLMTVTRAISDNSSSTTTYSYAPIGVESEYRPQSQWKWGHEMKTYHLNLGSIIRPANEGMTGEGIYTFVYGAFDASNKYLDETNGIYYVQAGYPRPLAGIILPDGSRSNFERQEISHFTLSGVYGNLGLTDGYASARSTLAIDAENNAHLYEFKDQHVDVLYNPYANGHNERIPRIVYFQNMVLRHFNGCDVSLGYPEGTSVPYTIGAGTSELGNESFFFDVDSGLQVCKIIDFCGNETSFTYEDAIGTATNTSPAFLRVPLASIASILQRTAMHSDPTSETRTLSSGRAITKEFTYDGNSRIMTSATDGLGRKTVTQVDALGRRINERVYADIAQSQLVQEKIYTYDDANFKGFLRSETINALPADGSGAVDLVKTFTPDAYGRISRETFGSGSELATTSYTYDLRNNKLTQTDALGRKTAFSYDGLNRLTTVSYFASGSTSASAMRSLSYDLNSNKIAETDENQNTTTYVYDALNRRISESRALDGQTTLTRTFSYNALNAKTAESDFKGNVTHYTYDGLLRLIAKEDPADLSGRRPTQWFYYEPSMNCGASAFDSDGFKPTHALDPMGYWTIVCYDALYRPIISATQYERTDSPPSGSFVDPSRLLMGLYVAGGIDGFAVTQTVYDDAGNPTEETTYPSLGASARTTQKGYDALNRLIAVVHPDGATESVSYTTTGLEYRKVDANGNMTTTQYDSQARPIRIADAMGGITTQSYDLAGNMIAKTNPLGATWTYAYDYRNRKILETAPSASVFADSASAPSAQQAQTLTAYDGVGNIVAQTDARGHTVYTEYDAMNRPVACINPPTTLATQNGTQSARIVTKSVYDGNGNILETWAGTVSANATTSANAVFVRKTADNTYDALNRLVKTVNGAGIPVVYEYDLAGNRIAVVAPAAHSSVSSYGNVSATVSTNFVYDGLKRLLTVAYPPTDATASQTSEAFTYDAFRKLSRIAPNGEVTQYAYDSRDRLTSVTYTGTLAANASQGRSYTYDAVGNILSVAESYSGALAGVGDVAYTYDALNRIASETQGSGASAVSHAYTYDAAGNRIRSVFGVGRNDARLMTSTYDTLNRTLTISENGRTSGYGYDLNGNIVRKYQPNGDTVSTAFDALNRAALTTGPNGADNQPLYRYENTYDLYGNLARLSETYPSSGSQLEARTLLMVYDAANRLTAERQTNTGGDIIETLYAYDAANNRASLSASITPVNGSASIERAHTYTYNILNQLTEYTDSISATTTTYSYDANGSRILKSCASLEETYSYDAENRLIALTQEGATPAQDKTYQYAYDYRTRRVLRDESSAGGTVSHVVFSGGTSQREYTGNLTATASPAVEFVRGSDYGGGIGGILYSLRGNEIGVKHYNARGDVTAQTNGQGSLTFIGVKPEVVFVENGCLFCFCVVARLGVAVTRIPRALAPRKI